MLYIELLKETLSVIGYSLFLTVFCYVLLSWLLWKQNKYNIKNVWFIIGSVVLVPFLFIGLSGYLAADKVNDSVIEPAKNYACSFASKVDRYSEAVPTVISGVAENVVTEGGKFIKQKVSVEVESIVSVAQDSLQSAIDSRLVAVSDSLSCAAYSGIAEGAVDALADSVIALTVSNASKIVDRVVDAVEEPLENVINMSIDLLPTNVVVELKNKFPALSLFLTDKGIDGDTSEEIVASIFNKATTAIKKFKNSRIRAILKYVLIFSALSLLAGWRKERRMARKTSIEGGRILDNGSDLSE